MTTMQNSTEITRTPREVLDYVSSPSRWQEWHPYPISISAAPGPLPVGSRFEYLGGRAGQLSWEVVECIPDQLWRARAQGRYGLKMLVTYECTKTREGTHFVRTLEYQFSKWVARIANILFLKRRIRNDSRALVARLGDVAHQFIPSTTRPVR